MDIAYFEYCVFDLRDTFSKVLHCFRVVEHEHIARQKQVDYKLRKSHRHLRTPAKPLVPDTSTMNPPTFPFPTPDTPARTQTPLPTASTSALTTTPMASTTVMTDEPLMKTYKQYFTPQEVYALSAKQRGKMSTAKEDRSRQVACGFINAVGQRMGL